MTSIINIYIISETLKQYILVFHGDEWQRTVQ